MAVLVSKVMERIDPFATGYFCGTAAVWGRPKRLSPFDNTRIFSKCFSHCILLILKEITNNSFSIELKQFLVCLSFSVLFVFKMFNGNTYFSK